MIEALRARFDDRAGLAGLAAPLGAAVVTAVVLSSPRLVAATVGVANPILIVAALVFGGLVIRYSPVGVSVLVVFVFLDLSEALVRYHNFPSLLQLLVLGLAFAAWLKFDLDRLGAVASQPLTMTAAAWIAVCFVSTAWAADRDLADDRVVELAKAFAIYLLATALMRSRQRLVQAAWALVGSALLVGVLSIYQYASGQLDRQFGGLARYKQAQIYGDVFEPRIAGPVGDPNFFAQSLLLVLPFVVVGVAAAPTVWRRLGVAAVMAAILFTIVLTYSRGALVALAVVAVMLARTLRVRWSTVAVALVLGAALAVAVLPAGVTKRALTLVQVVPGEAETARPDSSFAERRVFMEVALAMFSAHPIEGVGVANYAARYDDFVGSVGSAARFYPGTTALRFPHNLYLEVAAETGALGLAAFAALLIAAFHATADARRAFTRADDRTFALLAAAVAIALAGFLLASVFLHLALPRHFFLILAFAASVQRLARRLEGAPDAA